jgi:hypothetical protein
MPNVYQTVFGGSLVAPAIPTYLALNITANVVLGWPLESNITAPSAAEIIDVTATPGLTIQLSDARQVSTGYCALFNNVGANTVSVLDANGGTLMSVASGQAWQIYLADNSTLAGTWRVFQYGAGVSSANAAALAGSGLKAISTTLNERIFINAQGANYTILSTDRAACVEWTGGAGGVFTSPNPATVGSDWFCYIKNSGTGILTFTPVSGTVDGAANKTFNPNDSAIMVTDGTNWFSMGFGQSVASAFNFVTISLAGVSGNFTLNGAQLNRISYKFTGLLAGNTTVIVPASIQQYWVDNETTGAFTLTFSAGGAGTTFTVPQANRTILYCDGLNVVNAITGGGVQFGDGTAAAPSITFASDLTLGLYKAGVDVLGFSTAGVQRGTISSAGGWVINAPASGAALSVTQVAGGASPAVSLASVVNTTYVTASDGTSTFIQAEDASHNHTLGTSTAHALSLLTNNTARVAVTSAGNATVNAPASGVALTVTAVSPNAAIVANDGGGSNIATFNSTAAVGGYINIQLSGTIESYFGSWQALIGSGSNTDTVVRAQGQLGLATGGANNRVTVSSTGAVTINTPGSGVALTVNAVAATQGIQINSTAGQFSGIAFSQSGQTAPIVYNPASTSNLVLQTSGADRVTVTSAGAVTIAVPVTGNNALTVNGVANSYAENIIAPNTSGQSLGLRIQAGTTSADFAVAIANAAASSTTFEVRGDGLVLAVDQGGTLQEVGWRGTPINTQSGNYTLVLSDKGKLVAETTASNTITVPANVFAANDVITIGAAITSGSITIAQGTSLTMNWANGTNTTGNRTLTGVGLATVIFFSPTACWITGSALN